MAQRSFILHNLRFSLLFFTVVFPLFNAILFIFFLLMIFRHWKTTTISWNVYKKYLRSVGWSYVISTVFVLIAFPAIHAAGFIWLAIWSEEAQVRFEKLKRWCLSPQFTLRSRPSISCISSGAFSQKCTMLHRNGESLYRIKPISPLHNVMFRLENGLNERLTQGGVFAYRKTSILIKETLVLLSTQASDLRQAYPV